MKLTPPKILHLEGPCTVFSAVSASRSEKKHYVFVFQDQRGIVCTCEGFQNGHVCWHVQSVPLCNVQQANAMHALRTDECYFLQGHGGGHSWETPRVSDHPYFRHGPGSGEG